MRDGLTEVEVADRMGLTAASVRFLIAQERDSRELQAFTQNWVETASVRSFIDCELERNPGVSHNELAEWLDMQRSDFDRLLGYRPGKNGTTKQRIGVSAASRVVIALGRAPHELDGC